MAEDAADLFLEGALPQAQTYTPTIPNLITDLNMDLLYTDEKVAQLNQDSCIKLFLIGMPSDIGVRAHDGRAGAERGPESFREMVSLCAMPSNPVSSQASLLENLKIFDCGNIPVNQGQAIEHKDMTKEQAGVKLAELTSQILSKVENSRIIVIGGSDELTLYLLKGLDSATTLADFKLLHLDPALDVKEQFLRKVDEDLPSFRESLHETNHSYLRKVLADEERISKLRAITFFGVQGHRVAQHEADLVNGCDSITTEIVYCKRGHLAQQVESIRADSELVSVDLSVVKSHFAPGVGLPSPAMGLTDTQICDVAHKVGQEASNKVFAITEYNPAIEKYRTGALMQNIFSSFLVGIAEKQQSGSP